MWYAGKFFVAGCLACDEKAAADPGLREAPTPEQAFRMFKAARTEKGQRPETHARRKAARAAMVKQWHETPPGKESARAGS